MVATLAIATQCAIELPPHLFIDLATSDHDDVFTGHQFRLVSEAAL
jgi:hypothetical protein